MMRVIIVDDEPLARARMRQVLGTDLGVEVVAECASAVEARTAIDQWDPDAVFLDIEMPEATGLELARDLDAAGHPLVVFVTAHVQYAHVAFDVSPVDYVLKPVETVRCRRALRRLEHALETRQPSQRRDEPASHLERLFVRDGERLLHLPVREIESFEALGNYVKIRATTGVFVVRGSLAELESRLNPARFVRTHRSHLVNITRVRELVSLSHGDYTVRLESGQSVPLSRGYRGRMQMFVLSAGVHSNG